RAVIHSFPTRRSSDLAEDALQLVGWGDLELIVAARLGRLVGPPANELRPMPESRSLHVVVRDFAHAFGPQRHPAQILAAIPAARSEEHTSELQSLRHL